MGRTVIQHQRSRRKRPSPWAWAARRLGALVVVVAGLAVATWLSLDLLQGPRSAKQIAAPPAAADHQIARTILPSAHPDVPEVNISLDLLGARAAPRRRPRVEDPGVPLNAAIERHSDDYEILSAAELASISQARD